MPLGLQGEQNRNQSHQAGDHDKAADAQQGFFKLPPHHPPELAQGHTRQDGRQRFLAGLVQLPLNLEGEDRAVQANEHGGDGVRCVIPVTGLVGRQGPARDGHAGFPAHMHGFHGFKLM